MTKLPSKELIEEWRIKLKKSGFNDIERPNGRLKEKNKRTKAYNSQESVKEYFELLGIYLNNPSIKLSRLERKILELYSEGKYHKEIGETVFRSIAYVKNIIYRHRDKILNKSG